LIEVVDLAKHFGAVHAVRHVTFRAPDGAITDSSGPTAPARRRRCG
jgi:ABC-type Na+ transport system ATPase subunit NatA